jgi:hypothetical protein
MAFLKVVPSPKEHGWTGEDARPSTDPLIFPQPKRHTLIRAPCGSDLGNSFKINRRDFQGIDL